jgi:hypothetical protein
LEPEFPIWNSHSYIVRFACHRHNEFLTKADPCEISGVPTARLRLCFANTPSAFEINMIATVAPLSCYKKTAMIRLILSLFAITSRLFCPEAPTSSGKTPLYR